MYYNNGYIIEAYYTNRRYGKSFYNLKEVVHHSTVRHFNFFKFNQIVGLWRNNNEKYTDQILEILSTM